MDPFRLFRRKPKPQQVTSTTMRCDRCGKKDTARRKSMFVDICFTLLGKTILYGCLCMQCQRAILGFKWAMPPRKVGSDE